MTTLKEEQIKIAKEVYNEYINSTNYTSQKQIDITGLKSGFYILKASTKQRTEVSKLVIH